MSPARELHALQQLEQDIIQAQRALAVVEGRLRGSEALEGARSRAAEAHEALAALQAQQRDLNLEVQSVAAHIERLDAQLYGGSHASPRELMGVQEEIRSLQQRRSRMEDRLLELMLRGDEAGAAADEADRALAAEESRWSAERGELEGESARLEGELERLAYQSAATAAALSDQERGVYRSLKASRGTAVARVERGICSGCGLSLPSRELQRARSSPDLVRCSSCGRVLFVS